MKIFGLDPIEFMLAFAALIVLLGILSSKIIAHVKAKKLKEKQIAAWNAMLRLSTVNPDHICIKNAAHTLYYAIYHINFCVRSLYSLLFPEGNHLLGQVNICALLYSDSSYDPSASLVSNGISCKDFYHNSVHYNNGIMNTIGRCYKLIDKMSNWSNIASLQTQKTKQEFTSCFVRLCASVKRLSELEAYYSKTLSGAYETKTGISAMKQLYIDCVHIRNEINAIEKDLSAILDQLISSRNAGIKQPKAVSVTLTETALSRTAAIVAKCKSVVVKNRFTALKPLLISYFDQPEKERDLDRRVNTYYLPTLDITLKSLVFAERKRSKKTSELEDLCLKSMDTIESILTSHEDAVDEATVRSVQVEVATMENLAKTKGDMPGDNELCRT